MGSVKGLRTLFWSMDGGAGFRLVVPKWARPYNQT